jgi:hypothetical protein
MGWDSIEFAGEHELFRDVDLWILRHFFVEEARVMEGESPSDDVARLRRFFEKWNWYGIGVFAGTNFSEYVGTDRGRSDMLLQLLQRAGDRAAAIGETIPVGYLNAVLDESPVGGCFTKAQPVGKYLRCIGRICSLISKHRP